MKISFGTNKTIETNKQPVSFVSKNKFAVAATAAAAVGVVAGVALFLNQKQAAIQPLTLTTEQAEMARHAMFSLDSDVTETIALMEAQDSLEKTKAVSVILEAMGAMIHSIIPNLDAPVALIE